MSKTIIMDGLPVEVVQELAVDFSTLTIDNPANVTQAQRKAAIRVAREAAKESGWDYANDCPGPVIFTDGSYNHSRNIGGYGLVFKESWPFGNGPVVERSFALKHFCNVNLFSELMGMAEGLSVAAPMFEGVYDGDAEVRIFTDCSAALSRIAKAIGRAKKLVLANGKTVLREEGVTEHDRPVDFVLQAVVRVILERLSALVAMQVRVRLAWIPREEIDEQKRADELAAS